MKLVEIKDKQRLNDFVAGQKRAEFLQSWQWGEFQERAGNKIFRLGVEDEKGELIAAATLIKKSLGLGMNYFFCPRGPIILKQNVIPSVSEESLKAGKKDKGFLSPFRSVQNDNNAVFDFLFTEIKKLAKKENVIFFRLEPSVIARSPEASGRRGNLVLNAPKAGLLRQGLAMTRTIDVEPSKTLMLDLSKSEEELLAAMHQKTRYNIRLAEKKGVKTYESPLSRGVDGGAERSQTGCVNFEKFWSLMSATVNRDGFRLHEKEYYQKMLETENVKLLFGEYKNKILCAGIFSFFGDTATYIHGASSNENREVMAPYLLQWEAIRMAKKAGCKYYDFYGIDEKKWPGVTRFKKGFSPANGEINYPGTFDAIFNKTKYSLYRFLRKLRRLIK